MCSFIEILILKKKGMYLLITDSILFEGTGSTSSNMKIDMGYLGYYGISQNMIWDVSAPAQKVSFTQFPPIGNVLHNYSILSCQEMEAIQSLLTQRSGT